MFDRTWSFWRRLVGGIEANGDVAVQESPDERRLWARFPADLEAAFKPVGAPDSARMSSRVRNVSLSGINLLVNRSFHVGEMLMVELPGASEETRCNVLACVVHCVEEQPGEWSLGCTFARELTDRDLESIGGRRERHATADQRQWKRFSCNTTATFQQVAAPNQLPRPAKVLNVSPTGVCLQVDCEIDNGALLSLELHNAAGTTERTMLACVVHVSAPSDGEWSLGCNFIRSLSEEDVKALVQ